MVAVGRIVPVVPVPVTTRLPPLRVCPVVAAAIRQSAPAVRVQPQARVARVQEHHVPVLRARVRPVPEAVPAPVQVQEHVPIRT